PRDVIASRDDHIVGTGNVPEIAVLVATVGVARIVPSVLDVVVLAWVIEVLTAGRAFDGQTADGTGRNGAAVVVVHFGDVPGNCPARRSGTHFGFRGADENVQHFGAADSVEDLQAGLRVPVLPDRLGQRFPCRDAPAQAREIELLGSGIHGP